MFWFSWYSLNCRLSIGNVIALQSPIQWAQPTVTCFSFLSHWLFFSKRFSNPFDALKMFFLSRQLRSPPFSFFPIFSYWGKTDFQNEAWEVQCKFFIRVCSATADWLCKIRSSFFYSINNGYKWGIFRLTHSSLSLAASPAQPTSFNNYFTLKLQRII